MSAFFDWNLEGKGRDFWERKGFLRIFQKNIHSFAFDFLK